MASSANEAETFPAFGTNKFKPPPYFSDYFPETPKNQAKNAGEGMATPLTDPTKHPLLEGVRIYAFT